MTEGRIYISDKTAESFGGRERVEEMFRRVGNGGHIVVFGEQDTPQEVARLLREAKDNSMGFFNWIGQDKLDRALAAANSPIVPALMSYDFNGDGRKDIFSFRNTERLFELGVPTLPGDPAAVREFLFSHEIGHVDSHNLSSFWDRWRNEVDADQDGFRGMGPRATREFQEGILAARAGNTLGDMIIMQELKIDSRSTFNILVDNPEFIHASVLGTFLPGEQPLEFNAQRLNLSLDNFRDAVLGRLYDNHVARNPNFRLDISSVSANDANYTYVNSFRSFIESKGGPVAERYQPFIDNMQELSDRQGQLWERYRLLGDDQQAQKDAIFEQIEQTQEQVKVELQQALDFMRETNPTLYREHIVGEYFGLFNRQAGIIDVELGQRTPQQFIAGVQKPMLDVVIQLRREGAFADDPIQRRLTDYIARDAEIRPSYYGLEASQGAGQGPRAEPPASAPLRP